MTTLKPILTLAVAVSVGAPLIAGELSPSKLIESLQAGGNVIYLRHAKTETDYADQLTADPNNCSTQRTLSEVGWEQAITIGAAIRDYNIPIATVTSSQYCRAWQTASLAFGTYTKTADLNFEKGETYTDAQTEIMRNHVSPMLSAVPAEGTNTVIVGHDDPFEAATGIYPEPQGVAYVLRPTGDGFEVLGHINPDAWDNAH